MLYENSHELIKSNNNLLVIFLRWCTHIGIYMLQDFIAGATKPGYFSHQ